MSSSRKQPVTNYPVGDFLIKLKNASMAGNKEVKTHISNKVLAIAEALKKLGYLDTVKKQEEILTVTLAFKNKKPLLMDVTLMSKPGLRIYMKVDEIEKKKGPSIFLITSPNGIISSRQAVKTRTGGEVIAEIL
ncbi:MAG TPA: 30S ribosomal protein S8 [Patescibacteria group bacterium]|nr:30S ribosomal protein S8 [Patescibacteria group bacterium]